MILQSRSGVSNEAGSAFIEELPANGVHTEAPACDIIQPDVLSRVIKACSAVMPSITGCVQSTMALRVGFRGALINLYLAHADM